MAEEAPGADVVIMAAAVAGLPPVAQADSKLKKGADDALSRIDLWRTPTSSLKPCAGVPTASSAGHGHRRLRRGNGDESATRWSTPQRSSPARAATC